MAVPPPPAVVAEASATAAADGAAPPAAPAMPVAAAAGVPTVLLGANGLPSAQETAEKKPDLGSPASIAKKRDKPKTVPVVMHKARDGKTFMVLEQLLAPAFDPRDRLPLGAQKESRAGEITRVILSCDRHNVKASVMLCAECNGAVIDARTWMPLAIPPRAFNPRHNATSRAPGLFRTGG